MPKSFFLTKSNQPSRITAKKLASYKRAKREGLSANENYNVAVFGISSIEYVWIGIATNACRGMFAGSATLKEINNWFADPGYLTDSDGRYLSYMGNTVSVFGNKS